MFILAVWANTQLKLLLTKVPLGSVWGTCTETQQKLLLAENTYED